jgi:CRISPR-associated endoribonuclease Cas6
VPYAIDFPISGDGTPPQNVYRILHANLLRWIDAVDPTVAAAIHDRPVRKPFTVSPLRVERGRGWRWRVTLLDDALWEPVWEGARAVGTLDLDGRRVPVRWPDALITHRTYDELLTRIQPETYLRMAFLSATTFRAGSLDSPLPAPRAVFHSWSSRWNDFAPPHRRIPTELLDLVYANVGIAAIDGLHTRRHDLGRSSPVGFVGRVIFVITEARKLNQADVWRLNALADYAEFCGTGRKTTQGMGQTRRLDRD